MALESGDALNDRNNVEQRISLDRDQWIGLDSNSDSVTLVKVMSLNFIICHMQKIIVLTSEDYLIQYTKACRVLILHVAHNSA